MAKKATQDAAPGEVKAPEQTAAPKAGKKAGKKKAGKKAAKKAGRGADDEKPTTDPTIDVLREQLKTTKKRLKEIDPKGRNPKIVEIIKRIKKLLEALACQQQLTKVF